MIKIFHLLLKTLITDNQFITFYFQFMTAGRPLSVSENRSPTLSLFHLASHTTVILDLGI